MRMVKGVRMQNGVWVGVFIFWLVFGLVGVSGAVVVEPLRAYDLRCDEMVDPLGVDAEKPGLSWKLRGEGRDRRQTAYRVLVASRAELLAEGRADVWDSGKRESSEQTQVRFDGGEFSSGQKVYWAVEVWDEGGRGSGLSAPATWPMGVVAAGDWGGARWIAHPDWLEVNRAELGFRSEPADTVDTLKWVQIDLGAILAVDTVRLHALRHTVAERLGFPTVFKVELAGDPEMMGAVVLFDYTETPYPNSWATRYTLAANGAEGRYLRVTAPKLRELNGEICLAFSQIEVISAGRNVALGAGVTASDSLENGLWSAAALVDGKGVPGSNPLGTRTAVARREFETRGGVARALLHVTGLGQYVAYLNGQRVGVDLLSPGWTDTDKTVLYDTRDVTELLHEGANAIGLELSSGMYSVYHPGERYTKFEGRFQPLMGLAKLDIFYADGRVETVSSDGSWRIDYGPTVYSHVYGGEDYDAREEQRGWKEAGFADAGWAVATEVEGPGGILKGASFTGLPIRGTDRLRVKETVVRRAGLAIYDFGQNAALMPRLSARGPVGAVVRVTPSELLKADGSLDRGSSAHGGKAAYWQFTLSGTGRVEHWAPEFFYHGARYLQVELLPAAQGGALPELVGIEASVTHAAAEAVGNFASSSDLFRRTRELIRWAQRSNQVSVLTDCPHRERLGWLEQYHLNGPSLRYEFGLHRLFRKTFGDMVDAQTELGLVPDIAPEFIQFEGGFRDSPEWGSALILAGWQQYLWSGDDGVFRLYFGQMERYVAYLGSKADGHIVSHGLGDWYDLGPGRPGFAQLTPMAVTATATYYENVVVLGEMAERLGWTEKAERYRDLAGEIKAAFIERHFDAQSGNYGSESQTGNAMAYVLGLYPEGRGAEVLAAIVADIERRGNAFTAGDVGHRYLLLALSMAGRSDVVYAMHSASDRPGYGWQLAQGATSLTEAWDASPHSSQNHFMLGHIMEWFYGSLVGIAPDPEQPGFRNVIVAPQPVEGIDWAEASFESARGPVSARWRREGETIALELELAPNMTGSVRLPGGYELVKPVDGARGEVVDGVLRLGSGRWELVLGR